MSARDLITLCRWLLGETARLQQSGHNGPKARNLCFFHRAADSPCCLLFVQLGVQHLCADLPFSEGVIIISQEEARLEHGTVVCHARHAWVVSRQRKCFHHGVQVHGLSPSAKGRFRVFLGQRYQSQQVLDV